MKAAFGETHPLVQLTLSCLQYDQEHRPTASEVLNCLEEVNEAVPKSVATKLDLMCQQSGRERQHEETHQMRYMNLLSQNRDLIWQVTRLQADNSKLQTEITERKQTILILAENNSAKLAGLEVAHEKMTKLKDRIQAEQQEQARGFNELITLQQQELEKQSSKIDCLNDQLKTLQIGTQPYQAEGVYQNPVKGWRSPSQHQSSLPPPREALSSLLRTSRPPPAQGPVPPHSVPSTPCVFQIIASNGPLKLEWRRCNNMPHNVNPLCQPVALDNKLYFQCISSAIGSQPILFEYTPSLDLWKDLSFPPILQFSLAILEGHLIAIGERKKSFGKSATSIYVFHRRSGKWALSNYPAMPSEYAFSESTSVVVGYFKYLIIAGGVTSKGSISSVSILSTEVNRWFQTKPLLYPDQYRAAIINGFLFLVGQTTRVVVRANLSALFLNSGDVWERLANAHFYYLVPIALKKHLLVMSGRVLIDSEPMTTIQQYKFDRMEWSNVGDLAEPFIQRCYYTEHCDKLYVFGGHQSVLFPNNSVYVTECKLSS